MPHSRWATSVSISVVAPANCSISAETRQALAMCGVIRVKVSTISSQRGRGAVVNSTEASSERGPSS